MSKYSQCADKRTLLSFIDVADQEGVKYITGVVGVSMLVHRESGARVVIWAERHDVLNPCSHEHFTVASLLRLSRPNDRMYMLPEGLVETTKGYSGGAIHAVFGDILHQADRVQRDAAVFLMDSDAPTSVFHTVPMATHITVAASVERMPGSGAKATILFTDMRDEYDGELLARYNDDERILATELVSMFHSEGTRTRQERVALRHATKSVPRGYIVERVVGIIRRHFAYVNESDAERAAIDYTARCTEWHKIARDRFHDTGDAALAAMMPVFDVVLMLVLQHIARDSQGTFHLLVGDSHRVTIQQMLLLSYQWGILCEFSSHDYHSSCLDLQTMTFVP